MATIAIGHLPDTTAACRVLAATARRRAPSKEATADATKGRTSCTDAEALKQIEGL